MLVKLDTITPIFIDGA